MPFASPRVQVAIALLLAVSTTACAGAPSVSAPPAAVERPARSTTATGPAVPKQGTVVTTSSGPSSAGAPGATPTGPTSMKVVATPAPAPAAAVPVAASAGSAPPRPPIRAATSAPTFVTIEGTGGAGAWMRRDPAGAGVKVWPDGAPFLVVGPDQPADGQAWSRVRATDGQAGWVAAAYLHEVDATLVATLRSALETSTALPGDPAPASHPAAVPPSPAPATRPGSGTTAIGSGAWASANPAPAPSPTAKESTAVAATSTAPVAVPAASTPTAIPATPSATATATLPPVVPDGAIELPAAIATAYSKAAPTRTPAVRPIPPTAMPAPTKATKATSTKSSMLDEDAPTATSTATGRGR